MPTKSTFPALLRAVLEIPGMRISYVAARGAMSVESASLEVSCTEAPRAEYCFGRQSWQEVVVDSTLLGG